MCALLSVRLGSLRRERTSREEITVSFPLATLMKMAPQPHADGPQSPQERCPASETRTGIAQSGHPLFSYSHGGSVCDKKGNPGPGGRALLMSRPLPGSQDPEAVLLEPEAGALAPAPPPRGPIRVLWSHPPGEGWGC